MLGWIWLGELVLGAVLGAAFARGLLRTYSLFGLGLLIGLFILLAAYLAAAPDFAHSNGCSDCQMFLGRWWEPGFVTIVAGLGYLVFLVGIGVGVGIREVVRAPAAIPSGRTTERG
jgi:hypothetical protein